MVHKHIGVPSDFFPEVMPGLDYGELRLYLQVVWEQRWFMGKPKWIEVDYEELWSRLGMYEAQGRMIFQRLAVHGLVEFVSEGEGEEIRDYVRLCWRIN